VSDGEDDDRATGGEPLMPMPRWWGQINKRVFNPGALENGRWQVITHVGRSSGRTYRTPLGAHEVDGTFVFVLVYGSRCDWAQNILVAGSASLEVGDEVVELSAPRIIPGETAMQLLDGVATPPPGFLRIDEFLQMDVVARRPATEPIGSPRT
jgi:deazaflavin-dependent oxidoreductase (nitroreductase family)